MILSYVTVDKKRTAKKEKDRLQKRLEKEEKFMYTKEKKILKGRAPARRQEG